MGSGRGMKVGLTAAVVDLGYDAKDVMRKFFVDPAGVDETVGIHRGDAYAARRGP